MSFTDIFSELGGLEKLKITAFEDDTYANSVATYVVMYNPASYSFEVATKWLTEDGANPDNRQVQFRSNASDKVSFEFLFDATGASPPGNDQPGDPQNLSYLSDDALNRDTISSDKVSAIEIIREDKHVDRAIHEFLNITRKIQSGTHVPNYLQINWGAYQFRGVMEKATINYKLFNASGLPIRATVSANFIESLSREEQAAEANRNSPDLTHERIVKGGDNLPLMAHKIYGDPSYYMELARINNLDNFRKLSRGQRLVLPPVKK